MQWKRWLAGSLAALCMATVMGPAVSAQEPAADELAPPVSSVAGDLSAGDEPAALPAAETEAPAETAGEAPEEVVSGVDEADDESLMLVETDVEPGDNWLTEAPRLEVTLKETECVRRVLALCNDAESILYDVDAEPEEGEEPLEPLTGEQKWAWAPEALEAEDGVYRLVLRVEYLDETHEEQEWVYRIDPVTPTLALEPGEWDGEGQPLHLNAQAGPSGFTLWMKAGEGEETELAGEDVVLEEGSYAFRVQSGAGLWSEPVEYTVEPQEAPSEAAALPQAEEPAAPALQANSLADGWHDLNGRWAYVLNGERLKGWQTLEGRRYYFDVTQDPEGLTLTGKAAVEGRTYYFDPATRGGIISGFLHLGGQLFYFSAQDYTLQTGLIRLNDALYYANTQDGALYTSGWFSVGTNRYYALYDGQLQVGHSELSGKYYFFDRTGGQMLTGLIQDTNEAADVFYADGNGELQTGIQKVDGKQYYFANDGKAKSGVLKVKGKYYYYLKSTKALKVRGWAKEDGKWYYAQRKDSTLATGSQKIGGKYYYFNKKGLALSGKRKVDKQWTFFRRDNFSRAKGFVNDKGKIYYVHKKTGAMLFGWQKIGKYEYYFQKNGQAAVGTHKIGGVNYTFDAKGRLQKKGAAKSAAVAQVGIDVSAWQKQIDWAAAKSSGQVDFAIMRALTWDSASNNYTIDPTFDYNVRQAKKNGIRVGVYIYSYAFNNNEMVAEIDYFHNHPVVQQLRRDGVIYDLPVFIDYEWPKIIDNNPTKAGRTDTLRVGLQRLVHHGYTAGFYSNHNWAVNHYDAAALEAEGYDFWYARYYGNTPGQDPAKHGWTNPPAIWQYTSKGTVAGVPGHVDMNYSYKKYPFYAM